MAEARTENGNSFTAKAQSSRRRAKRGGNSCGSPFLFLPTKANGVGAPSFMQRRYGWNNAFQTKKQISHGITDLFACLCELCVFAVKPLSFSVRISVTPW